MMFVFIRASSYVCRKDSMMILRMFSSAEINEVYIDIILKLLPTTVYFVLLIVERFPYAQSHWTRCVYELYLNTQLGPGNRDMTMHTKQTHTPTHKQQNKTKACHKGRGHLYFRLDHPRNRTFKTHSA